jgi:hypothetical protein
MPGETLTIAEGQELVLWELARRPGEFNRIDMIAARLSQRMTDYQVHLALTMLERGRAVISKTDGGAKFFKLNPEVKHG